MQNSLNNFIILIILLSTIICSPKSDRKMTDSESYIGDNPTSSIRINIRINEEIKIGIKGNFYLDTEFYDSDNIFASSNIEEKTLFNTSLNNVTEVIFNISCRLWKPTDGNIKIFCQIYNISDIEFNRTYMNLHSNEALFIYNNNIQVYISNSANFNLRPISKPSLPFIYSTEQKIEIRGGQDSYEIKFMINEYNNEQLYLLSSDNNDNDKSYIYLDKCSTNNNNLICEIKKNDIEEILHYDGQEFYVYFYHSYLGEYKIELIDHIIIKDDISKKEVVYMQITKLLQNVIDYKNYIAYETNITSISNIVSAKFEFPNYYYTICYLKKAGEEPLLILCNWDYSRYKYLRGNKEEIILDNINIKYNFNIQPSIINTTETFNYYNSGSTPIFFYPNKELDFTLREEFTINYLMNNPSETKEIRLIPHFNNLDCINYQNKRKICNINRDYFRNEKSGYYYTYHSNSNFNNDSIFYEFSPIHVTINDKKIYISLKPKLNSMVIGLRGTIFFDTDYIDNEANILDSSDLDEWEFPIMFKGDNGYNYTANCILWKPNINKNISLICTLIDIINRYISYKNEVIFSIDEARLNYKEYTFIFDLGENIIIKQINLHLPFLYSEERFINVKELKQEVNLVFNIIKYNYQELFLVGSYEKKVYLRNYIKLDNCEVEQRKINCKISKQKLEEILIQNNEQFRVVAIDNDIGIVEFDYIKPITLNYDVIEKADIYIGITKLLNNVTNCGIPIAIETNITSLPNLQSDIFDYIYRIYDGEYNGYCYFKKIKNTPLLILCTNRTSYNRYILYSNQENVLSNIHYKFRFRIQPYALNEGYNVENSGEGILLTDLEELNFVSQNSINIRLIMGTNNTKTNYISLMNSNSSTYTSDSLACKGYFMINVCNIPISYFIKKNYKDNGLYYIYQSYNNYNFKIDYGIAPIKVTFPDKMIVINIKEEDNPDKEIICRNAKFYLITDYYDSENIFDATNIEEKTSFQTTIRIQTNSDNFYKITCKLRKLKDSNLIIICQSDTYVYIEKDYSSIKGYLGEVVFDYNGYRIVILNNFNNFVLNFDFEYRICPFLISDEQSINIGDNKTPNELKFEIDSYNNEQLFMSNMNLNYIKLECFTEEKNLKCTFEKTKLLEQNNNQVFRVYFYDENYGFHKLDLISGITINTDIKKETIYVRITNLKDTEIYYNNFVAYNTNVSEISNLISDYFIIDTSKTINCFFKKSELGNLLVLCHWPFNKDYSLEEIKKEIILDNIHIKYNFRIQPREKTEKFESKGEGSWPLFLYPQEIDFYRDDSSIFEIFMNFPEKTSNIWLDSQSNILECYTSSYSRLIKKCVVKKQYFQGKYGDQYYYIHYGTSSNYQLYKLSPILIKMPKENDIILVINSLNNNNPVKVGNEGILYFITDFTDSNNIFNYTDIEENTEFSSNCVDESKNEYNVDCRLWKSQNNEYNKIRLICKLKDNLIYTSRYIKLNDTIFSYNNYTIYIFSNTYFSVNHINDTLPFLYSDEQEILIDYNNAYSNYYFSFNFESYNNDKLFLYDKGENNYLLIDDCKANNKILNCSITINKLDEIMTTYIKDFSVGVINDNLGAHIFNSIIPIKINYYNHKIEKNIIYVRLVKLNGYNQDKGIPFGYETNVSDIPNLTTQKKEYSNCYCYFKKIEGKNLLYLCRGYSGGECRINIDYKIYDDIHWKYDFFVANYINDYFYIENRYASDIRLVYPLKLDFSNKEKQIIRYITSSPSYSKNIRLNLNINASDLGCEDLENMKLCYVSLAHFRYGVENIFDTYYLNKNTQGYTKYYGLPSIEVTLPEYNFIEFLIEDKKNKGYQYLGKDNILYFITNYNDTSNMFDNSEISKFPMRVKFTVINDNNNYYKDSVIDGACRFWEHLHTNVRLICKLDTLNTANSITIFFNENIVDYNNKKLVFYSNARNLQLITSTPNISFLYSGNNPEINMNDNTNLYELKIQKESYYNNQLYLYKNKYKCLGLECNDKGTELVCNINRDKLMEILSYDGEQFKIYEMISNYRMLPIDTIFNITINYPNPTKNDISLEITKLLTPVVELDSFVTYETNITEIPIITTDFFNLTINSSSNLSEISCMFKKNNEKKNEKLLLLCLAVTQGESSLNLIDLMIKSNINIQYNFKITSKNLEKFLIVSEKGSIIYSVSPKELDFTKQDSYIIKYETDNPSFLEKIKLNINSDTELDCENKEGEKECKVTQSHFTKNGEYYTYHYTGTSDKLISYEITTIKITLKPTTEKDTDSESESDSNSTLIGIIVGSVVGGLVIIGIIVFLVFRCKRKSAGGNTSKKEVLLQSNIELKDKEENADK